MQVCRQPARHCPHTGSTHEMWRMACAMVVCSFLILCPSSSTSTLQRFQYQSLYRVGLIARASPWCGPAMRWAHAGLQLGSEL